MNANPANTCKRRGLFVAGADTGVGKTTIACRLIRALGARGLRVAARKPVESGCRRTETGLLPEDATQLARAAGGDATAASVCRYRFAEPVSPARAAQHAEFAPGIADLAAACETGGEEVAVVEGAGGLLSPLASDGSNADLASRLGLPVLVVSADRLGCINHTLLTLEALAARKLSAIAVVLNPIPGDAPNPAMDNAAELMEMTEVPVIATGSVETGHDPAIEKIADLVIQAFQE